jgi:hypothetical protein
MSVKALVRPMYEARFRPYLIPDARCADLVLRVAAGMRPSALFAELKRDKWLVTAAQAHELMAAGERGCKKAIESLPAGTAAPPGGIGFDAIAYQDAACSRCFERYGMQFRGHEGYYHPESVGDILPSTLADFAIFDYSKRFFW